MESLDDIAAPEITPDGTHRQRDSSMPNVHSVASPFDVLAPARQTAAVVFASPHSGRQYPPSFLTASRLDATAIRRSEDAFVDELFAAAPQYGAPLIRAHVPRAYIDLNRDPYELDPGMFVDALPDYVDTASPRVAAGLGTVARIVASGEPIYRQKLLVADALNRVETCHKPYHLALQQLTGATLERFGCCLLIDCHSMPSIDGPSSLTASGRRVDMILGDRHGSACHPLVTEAAESALRDMGYAVRRNAPYAGGYTTSHYGRPADGRHALQIEINRSLYMDEARIIRGPGFKSLKSNLDNLLETLTRLNLAVLLP
jgi:N-formylglutamate amidohydrolase